MFGYDINRVMKPYFRRLLLVYTSIFLSLNVIQCSSLGKLAPEHVGVDPQLQHFVNKYKEIAAMQGIHFKHEVTIGFKDLNDGATVGLTSYGIGFREIDIDTKYFNNSTELTRETLLEHELSHAYCGREHDWGDNKLYPEFKTWKEGEEPKEGRYRDGTECPLSIMYPSILDDFCVLIHYSDYMLEMFQRCQPY